MDSAPKDGRFVLVDRSAESRYAEAVRGLEHLVAYVADPDASQPSLFVRPDGVIAWADNGSDDNARKLLATAIERWAGV